MFPADWLDVFGPETPLFELLARGSALYFGVLALVRLMPRRTGGELATMDLIFVLLIAEAAAHALGDYSSVADGLVTIATLMAWNYVINLLSFRFPAVERLVSSPPIQIIRDGELLRRNMRREYVTEEELTAHLREEGLERFDEVKSAHVEGDGKITFIPKKK
nr:YetF domain-containing protein [Sphingomonas sp. IC-11]